MTTSPSAEALEAARKVAHKTSVGAGDGDTYVGYIPSVLDLALALDAFAYQARAAAIEECAQWHDQRRRAFNDDAATSEAFGNADLQFRYRDIAAEHEAAAAHHRALTPPTGADTLPPHPERE